MQNFFLLLVVVFLMFPMLAYAHHKTPDPDPAFLNLALQEASNLTGLPITRPPPTVIFMHNHKKFVEIGCRVTKINCTAEAAYGFTEKTIYIDATQVDVYSDVGYGILVHEMVHHLQGNVTYNKDTCPAIERQAYTAQDTFLRKHGKHIGSIERGVHDSCLETN